MAKSKINTPRPLTADEIELLDAWREVALDRMAEDKRARIVRREQRLGRWDVWDVARAPADRLALWRASDSDLQCARYVLTIGTGGRMADALAAAGWDRYAQWLTGAGATAWSAIYGIALSTAVDITADRARDRIDANIANGDDGGYKSAVYLLDWWRHVHGQAQQQTDNGQQATNGGGVTYNIAIMSGTAQKLCGNCVADIPQITATAAKQGVSATIAEG